jgi:hypothetical protein
MDRSSLPATGLRRSALPSLRAAGVVMCIITPLSWGLHVATNTDFFAVLGRIGFVATAMLLAYSAAGALAWSRLLAVGLMAPVASFITIVAVKGSHMLVTRWDVKDMVGYVLMCLIALAIGMPLAQAALRRERKERESADKQQADAERLQADAEREKLERELAEARLRLLQAQIEPHFLFNTLANIEALVSSGSGNAGPVLRHLIAYLQAAVPRLNDADATLDTELQLVSAYLELMRLRMPDRLQFTVVSMPALQGMRFPAMALLTLVENAVRHGIDPSIKGGSIKVDGKLDPSTGIATVSVDDTGVGIDDMAPAGTGLTNLRSRLQAFYGPGARLELFQLEPHGVRVELTFPLRSAP